MKPRLINANALMEYCQNQIDKKIDCNDIARFPTYPTMEWHDLRKNPKDLPEGHKIVLNQSGMSTEYDPDRGFLGFGGCGIIAWTDVPFFKE